MTQIIDTPTDMVDTMIMINNNNNNKFKNLKLRKYEENFLFFDCCIYDD